MIKADRIKRTLETFSFPRLSGTEGEKNAFKIIENKVNELNLNPQGQDFTFSTFYARVYPKIGFSLGFWLLFICFLNIKDIFMQINLILIFTVLIILFIITRKSERIKIGNKLNSQNLFVKFPLNHVENNIMNIKDGYNIFLFAHVDSKSQRFSILARVKFLRLWVRSFILSIFLILLYNFIIIHYYTWFFIFLIIPLGMNFISTLFILLNTTNNNSSGSIDNGSGVSCLFEILYHYRESNLNLKNHDLWFVFTGAEECGTCGIRYFYEMIKYFNKEKTIFINFDAIAQGLVIYSSFNEKNIYYKPFKKVFQYPKNLRVILHSKRKFLAFARSDGYFLRIKGFKGISFGDNVPYKFIHSKNDTPDKVDCVHLEKLCNLVTNFIQEIENKS